MPDDLYADLEISRTADYDEIRKAYKRLSLIHHPDRGGDEEKFKKIEQAHAVLTDENRRKMYDMTGSIDGENGGGGGGNGNGNPFAGFGGGGMADIFGQMFGGMGGMNMGGMNMGGGRSQQMKRPKGPPKIHEISLSLSDFYNGKHFSVKFGRQKFCSGCKGDGATTFKSCDVCQGSGISTQMMMIGPGMAVQTQGPCRECQGRGKSPNDTCKTCSGSKFQTQEKTLDIHIVPGSPVGDVIIFQEECSDQHEYERPGDVHFVLQNADETIPWKRTGNDLFATITITLKESLLGVSKTLEGHPGFVSGYTFHIPVGTVNMEVIRKQGDGMPKKGNGQKEKGDALLTIKVEASDKEKEVLERNKIVVASMFS